MRTVDLDPHSPTEQSSLITNSTVMSTWGVVLVYLLVFLVVQLALYRYLRRQREDEDGDGEGASKTWMSPPGTGLGPTGEHVYQAGSYDWSDGGERDAAGEDSHNRDRTGGSGRRCPNCGTHNETDEMYTFCRNCVSRLPG